MSDLGDLPDPAPTRLVTLKTGLRCLAFDACFTCEGTRLVKRGAMGLYPYTTATGCLDRAVMRVFACPTCGGTGLREMDDVDRDMLRRLS